MIIFSERLRELRINAGYTQQQIAEMLNIKQQSYARYELGSGEPNLETVAMIAKIFGVCTDYLLGIVDFENYR